MASSGASRKEIADQSNGILIPADENPFRVTTGLCLVCVWFVPAKFCLFSAFASLSR